MKIPATALLVCLASVAAFGDEAAYPDGYWERQYGYGQQYSIAYSVALKVPSAVEARDRVIAVLEKSGGRPSNSGYGYQRSGQIQISYLIPAERAEKTAKRLFAIGELQQFSNQKMGSAGQLPEIQEKIASIQGELKSNPNLAERAPISHSMLTNQLNRLTQARDSAEASAATAVISVSLSDPSFSEGNPGWNGSRSYRRAMRPGASSPADFAAKGSLGALRSALSIYYGDTEGVYPKKLSNLTLGGKYLTQVPRIQVGPHAASEAVVELTGVSSMDALKKKLTDKGGWAYVADPKSPIFGTVVINCTHTDANGTAWADY